MIAKRWCAGLFCAAIGWAQPSGLVGIAHVAFRVADLEAARSFYRKLGFEQFFEIKQGERTTEAFSKSTIANSSNCIRAAIPRRLSG